MTLLSALLFVPATPLSNKIRFVQQHNLSAPASAGFPRHPADEFRIMEQRRLISEERVSASA